MCSRNMSDLFNLIGGDVIVVGSLNADYSVSCARLPRPGETVEGRGISLRAGGKSSNQAVAASRIGANVRMVGAVGSDSLGTFLKDELVRAGVDASGVSVVEGSSGTALVEIDDSAENSIVVSPGANACVDASFVRTHKDAIAGGSVLGLCLEIPMEGVVEAARIAAASGSLVLLNNSPFVPDLPDELVSNTDVLLVNEHEAKQMVGEEGDLPDDLDTGAWKAVMSKLAARGFASSIVTRGGKGSVVCDHGEMYRVDPVPVDAVDTTGCGDAFMGAVLAGLASGLSLKDSSDLASYVSAFAAMRLGAQSSYGTVAEIEATLL